MHPSCTVSATLAASLFLLPLLQAGDTEKPIAPAPRANYELAARWTSSKVAKRVFDIAVTPHWLAEGDRFWYSWENSSGRKFYIVDPARKSKSQVFDPVKLAALLTIATGLPYDSQHLPMRTIKFVKNDATIQFDLSVPREAHIPGEKKIAVSETSPGDDPQQRANAPVRTPAPPLKTKTITYEYELATTKLTLLEERPKPKPRWANISPTIKPSSSRAATTST